MWMVRVHDVQAQRELSSLKISFGLTVGVVGTVTQANTP